METGTLKMVKFIGQPDGEIACLTGKVGKIVAPPSETHLRLLEVTLQHGEMIWVAETDVLDFVDEALGIPLIIEIELHSTKIHPFYTTPDFWECDCNLIECAIHHKSIEKCHICQRIRNLHNCPDARVADVLKVFNK